MGFARAENLRCDPAPGGPMPGMGFSFGRGVESALRWGGRSPGWMTQPPAPPRCQCTARRNEEGARCAVGPATCWRRGAAANHAIERAAMARMPAGLTCPAESPALSARRGDGGPRQRALCGKASGGVFARQTDAGMRQRGPRSGGMAGPRIWPNAAPACWLSDPARAVREPSAVTARA